MVLNKFSSETFFVSRTQNLCPQQMLRARANGETFVSATMCPRLPGPYQPTVPVREIPGWIVVVIESFTVNKGAYRK